MDIEKLKRLDAILQEDSDYIFTEVKGEEIVIYVNSKILAKTLQTVIDTDHKGSKIHVIAMRRK